MDRYLTPAATLPEDGCAGTLVGRLCVPGEPGGPAVVAVREDGLYDLTPIVPTMSELIAREDRVAVARSPGAPRIAGLEEVLANSHCDQRRPARPYLLAPCDLQAVKAAGVTFVKSMIERVIEEQCKGDPSKADGIRQRIEGAIGASLREVRPGSPEAARVKEHLVAEGLWSQYLEVGIGPDAEIFTKAQPLSSVGQGSEIGIHRRSSWNNPEPEVVLVVDPDGRIVGATLGNDVNLRDFEGRSALLLGKAKDNNAASAVGPFIRLFDETFEIADVRAAEVRLEVAGEDGFVLEGSSSMREISRDPEELVANMMGGHHHYPDGALLFCGTMFAPTKDRGAQGMGFTHKLGDLVAISSARLGTLVNRVQYADKASPWTFGAVALMRNLKARGLL
ncbi:fumarylacetoacetate hydrolase family protein [Geminicoccaceae bacterium 1502E]|nr:fumarylacetoacetate hydrolase family protein [Geminicoccaceae bacterium 1502E]